jgi:BRO domain-containing protein
MNNNLITVNNVRGYIDENNVAWLNLEDVAYGLGFTKKDKKDGKEYIRIHSQNIKKWLFNFGLIKSENDELPIFIREETFYRLAMKAKNEIGVTFQVLVANEILPTLRKTGSYSINSNRITDKEIELREKELQERIERNKKESSELLIKISESFRGLIHEQILKSKAVEILTGDKNLLPPIQVEKTYSATELGELVEVSSKMIGILANKYNLKNNENTIVTIAMDKTGTDRETYRYKEHCVELFKEKYKDYLEEKLKMQEEKKKKYVK